MGRLTPPVERGPNNYHIGLKHEVFENFILYKGNSHFVWCYQRGQNLEMEFYRGQGLDREAGGPIKVNLADPEADIKIQAILAESDY